MNFLGHAYIARNHPELIAGNFAGDAYKGRLENYTDIRKDILNGVQLHRYIDDYTDHHPNIQEVVGIFQEEGVRKVGFIASDILLDHHLSANWKDYMEIDYPSFIDFVYQWTDQKLDLLPRHFQSLYAKLKRFGWFFDYPTNQGIEKIMRQFSQRIGFENDLLKSKMVYDQNIQAINKHFKTFLNDISRDSERFILDDLK